MIPLSPSIIGNTELVLVDLSSNLFVCQCQFRYLRLSTILYTVLKNSQTLYGTLYVLCALPILAVNITEFINENKGHERIVGYLN